jgi:hypothetical protein
MFLFESSINNYEGLLERDYLESIYGYLHAELGRKMDEYEFLLWSDTGDGHYPTCVQPETSKKRVLIHISDETSSVPLHLAGLFTAIFKCFLHRDYPTEGIYGLPLGYASGIPNPRGFPIQGRKFNVCFVGCLQTNRFGLATILSKLARSSEDRSTIGAARMVEDGSTAGAVLGDFSRAFPRSFIRFTSGFAKGLGRTKYGAILGDSKIALCPAGWKSSETFRHFEAMREGCILVSDVLPNTRIYRNAPIIQVRDWRSLDTIVSDLLRDTGRMVELQRLSLEWWNNVCSEKAVAAFIASQVTKGDNLRCVSSLK